MQNTNIDMLLSSYNYDLPPEFIAVRPAAGRHRSKLMVYERASGKVSHHLFNELPTLLPQGSHLVLNNSKVFPCRLYGERPSGGKCEVFLLSLVHQNELYPVMIKASGKRKVGDTFICGQLLVRLEAIEDGLWVRFNLTSGDLLEFLEQNAKIPIPPYIRGGVSDEQDREDYQTVYAKTAGSVAAPTAGLHFTGEIFNQLTLKGIQCSYVTLHVGAGTFKPVACENILEHKMHSEYFDIENSELEKLNAHQGNLIAVGTTTLRVLESCYSENGFKLPEEKPASTDIFLYPGKEIKSIRGMITNFHLPGSSLIMLVSSLIGREKTLELYEIAKANQYRFFSYGDAMLII